MKAKMKAKNPNPEMSSSLSSPSPSSSSPPLVALFWNYTFKVVDSKEKLLFYLQNYGCEEEFAECLRVARYREGLLNCWFNSIRGNDEAIIMEFIRVGMNVNERATNTEETALHIACDVGLEPVVQLLLNLEVDVNARDKLHYTPLMKACYGGFANILRLLLDRGAQVNATSKYDETGLLLACSRNRCDCVAMLLEAEARTDGFDRNGLNALMHAASKGYFAVIDLFANVHVDVNIATQNSTARTALCLAVRGRHVRAVYSLLTLGADRSIKDKEKKTVFDYALTKEMKDALESVDEDIGYLLK